jgi:hypothetical protein
MTLLIVSQFVTSDQPVAYGLLLGVAACLGTGFDGLGFWWGRPVMSAALLDMTRQVAASTTQAALALTTFWAIFGSRPLRSSSPSGPSSAPWVRRSTAG